MPLPYPNHSRTDMAGDEQRDSMEDTLRDPEEEGAAAGEPRPAPGRSSPVAGARRVVLMVV